MKKFVFLLLALLTSLNILAYDFSTKNSDGKTIYYNINSDGTSVTVTDNGYSGSYSGSIVIPQSVNYKGKSYSVTSLGKECFENCNSLTSVEIPSSVTSLGEDCFHFCSSLTSIIIPSSVTSLGDYCFSGCNSLTSIEIPNSVTSLGNACFGGCNSLTSVEIPSSVTSLGDYCFSGCNSLTSIEIPNSVASLGNACFAGCNNLSAFYGKYASEDHRYLIVDEILNSFAPSGLESYIIPSNVTSLGNGCFRGCSSLTSVEIPNSVTSLGFGCFYGCSSLTSIEIPNSVTSLGNCCFYGCSSLTSVEIPNSVTSLSYCCFYYCSSLTSVEIPNSVTSLGDYCFSYCSSLTSIEIPSSVTSLSYACFSDCSSLTSVEIPNSVTSLSYACFSDCSSLTSIEIPNSVTSLDDYCFSDCSSLTSIEIPNSVTSLGNACFAGCSNLSAFYGKYASEDHRCLIVDERLKSFAPSGLESYIIPSNVTSLGYGCFSVCSSLTSVEIPNSVTSLGNCCFYGCSSLTSFTINNDNPSNISLDYDVFYKVPTNTCILYVPKGSKALYAAADQWKEFRNIEEFDYTYCLNIPNSDLRRGQVNLVPVEMTNAGEVVSFQCDLSLPEGLSLEKNGDSYDVRKTDRTSEFVFSASDVDGKIRILGFSPTNTPISGNEGAIFSLPINVSEDVALGSNVTICLSNILITKKEDFEEVEAPTVASVHKIIKGYGLGDVNDDGKISVADISMAVEYVMGRTPSNSIKEAADVNEDGKISAADISIIVSYIMSGNTTPSPRIAPKSNNTNALDHAILSIDGNKVGVGVSSANAYTAAQFDVALPDGFSLSGIEMPNASTDHIATYSMLNHHTVRVLIYSPTNEQLPFGESLIDLSLSTSSTNASEWIGVDNMLLAAKEGAEIVEYRATGDNFYAEVSGISDLTSNGKLTVKTKNGNIIITSDRDTSVTITTISGQVQTEAIHAGENLIPATPGIYFVNGKKIILY